MGFRFDRFNNEESLYIVPIENPNVSIEIQNKNILELMNLFAQRTDYMILAIDLNQKPGNTLNRLGNRPEYILIEQKSMRETYSKKAKKRFNLIDEKNSTRAQIALFNYVRDFSIY